MNSLILLGTTSSTTWRQGVIDRLTHEGVTPAQIRNPHLKRGESWTPKHMVIEDMYKNDPDTIVFIHVCRADDRQILGATTMYEIGYYANVFPHRTAVVLDAASFDSDSRAAKVLGKISRELRGRFPKGPPLFDDLEAATLWSATQLTAA
jgi:hypothetical protein